MKWSKICPRTRCESPWYKMPYKCDSAANYVDPRLKFDKFFWRRYGPHQKLCSRYKTGVTWQTFDYFLHQQDPRWPVGPSPDHLDGGIFSYAQCISYSLPRWKKLKAKSVPGQDVKLPATGRRTTEDSAANHANPREQFEKSFWWRYGFPPKILLLSVRNWSSLAKT